MHWGKARERAPGEGAGRAALVRIGGSDACPLPPRHNPGYGAPAHKEEGVDGEGHEDEGERCSIAHEGADEHRGDDRDRDDEHAVRPQPPRLDTPRAKHEVGEHKPHEERPRNTREVRECERAVVAQRAEEGKEQDKEGVGPEGSVVVSHPATLAPLRGVKLREGPRE